MRGIRCTVAISRSAGASVTSRSRSTNSAASNVAADACDLCAAISCVVNETLALHLLQSCLVYVNNLLLQAVLADPAWAEGSRS